MAGALHLIGIGRFEFAADVCVSSWKIKINLAFCG